VARVIPVKLPDQAVEEIDELIREGRFLSRSDLLRQATRLLIDFERGRLTLHRLAEEYAYLELKRKLRRRP
jgi:Arc/MetJ-type ribon-helix-helix transcriptional regulator